MIFVCFHHKFAPFYTISLKTKFKLKNRRKPAITSFLLFH
nr:MAG TPA: hypothetical protein [Caudoviricetes sp.]